MATSLTRTPQECTDPPDSTDTLQEYEDQLQNKTRQHLIHDCIALNTRNVCLEALVQGLQAEEIMKQNDELVAKNRELTAKVEELTRTIEQQEKNCVDDRVKKLEEEIRSINRDRKKDAGTFKQEMEECKKQLQQAQEDVFKPILGIVQRHQEFLRGENLYGKVRRRAEENPYEEIQPGPPPPEAVTTRQKEPSHPKVSNVGTVTVNSQHVTMYQLQHFPQENTVPSANSLTKENLTKPPPHDNVPAHPTPHDQSLKAPVQSTDAQSTSRAETAPVSPNSEVMV